MRCTAEPHVLHAAGAERMIAAGNELCLLCCAMLRCAAFCPQTGAAAGPAPTFVKTHPRQRLADNPTVTAASASSSSSARRSKDGVCMYDVIVAGGTLGVFVAVALAQKGLAVAVVERGKLAGRTQEWNISRKELLELVEVSRRTCCRVAHTMRLDSQPLLCALSRFAWPY